MTTTPYAKVMLSKNGGTAASGAITGAASDVITLTLESTVDVTACLWEIYAYPPGFTVPSGWSTASDGTFYYSGVTPPTFTASAISTAWGKYLIRATVNNGILSDVQVAADRDSSELTYNSTALQVPHTSALPEVVPMEESQFSTHTYAADLRTTLRALITAYGGASFNAISYSSTAGFTLASAAASATPGTVTLKGADGSGSGGSVSIIMQPGQVTGSGTAGTAQIRDATGITRVKVSSIGVGFNNVTVSAIGSVTPALTSPGAAYTQAEMVAIYNGVVDIRNKLIALGLANA